MSSANQTAIDPRLIQDAPGLAGAWAGFRRRVSQGELGSLPVIIGLSAIWIIFYLANERFLSAINLTNLMLQISAMGMISAGIVLILLLGETDLSAGAVSGLAAAVMTILNVKMHVPAVPALLAGLAPGAGVGVLEDTATGRARCRARLRVGRRPDPAGRPGVRRRASPRPSAAPNVRAASASSA